MKPETFIRAVLLAYLKGVMDYCPKVNRSTMINDTFNAVSQSRWPIQHAYFREERVTLHEVACAACQDARLPVDSVREAMKKIGLTD